jgi:hypothetical protein
LPLINQYIRNITFLLPTSTQGAVELHKGQDFVELRLGQVELSRELIGIVGQHLQVACGAAPVAQIGQLRRVPGRDGQ